MPFLTKTYQLMDDPSVDDLISWNEDRTMFIMWRPAKFAMDLPPEYFKHNNFSPALYGFKKVVSDWWEMTNIASGEARRPSSATYNGGRSPPSQIQQGLSLLDLAKGYG
ncbi:hypothetical protein NL676_023558 [Syzygium grande]|nr:hypothetical protein NL676_023558 [Syzygium grande]